MHQKVTVQLFTNLTTSTETSHYMVDWQICQDNRGKIDFTTNSAGIIQVQKHEHVPY